MEIFLSLQPTDLSDADFGIGMYRIALLMEDGVE